MVISAGMLSSSYMYDGIRWPITLHIDELVPWENFWASLFQLGPWGCGRVVAAK